MSDPVRPLLPEWLTSPRARPWLLLLLLALIVLLAVLYLAPRPRSFALNVTTRSVTLTVTGANMTAWRLPQSIVCFRNEARPSGAAQAEYEGPCDPRLYEVADAGELEMSWSPGAQLVVTRSGEQGNLEILVRDPAGTQAVDRPLTADSRIVVTGAAWAQGNNLTFSAQTLLGQVPAPGSQSSVIEGTFEVREETPLQNRPIPVMSGELFPGDEVSITAEGGASVSSFGFIEPLGEGDAGFRVVAYSPPGHNVLRIDRFGAERIEAAPTWIDRALRDPIFAAVTTIGAFIGGATAVYSIVKGAVSPPAPAVPAQATPASPPKRRRTAKKAPASRPPPP